MKRTVCNVIDPIIMCIKSDAPNDSDTEEFLQELHHTRALASISAPEIQSKCWELLFDTIIHNIVFDDKLDHWEWSVLSLFSDKTISELKYDSGYGRLPVKYLIKTSSDAVDIDNKPVYHASMSTVINQYDLNKSKCVLGHHVTGIIWSTNNDGTILRHNPLDDYVVYIVSPDNPPRKLRHDEVEYAIKECEMYDTY